MSLAERVARLEWRTGRKGLVVVFLPREQDPDYHAECARLEGLKAAGRRLLVVDDSLGRHELWAGERRIE